MSFLNSSTLTLSLSFSLSVFPREIARPALMNKLCPIESTHVCVCVCVCVCEKEVREQFITEDYILVLLPRRR